MMTSLLILIFLFIVVLILKLNSNKKLNFISDTEFSKKEDSVKQHKINYVVKNILNDNRQNLSDKEILELFDYLKIERSEKWQEQKQAE